MRENVTLACTECKQRIEKSKFCKFCGKHTTHKETK